VSVLALGAPVAALAAAALSTPAKYAGAMTPQGIPNLEGTWTNITMSRFERDKEYGSRLAMTEAEVAKLEGFAAERSALGAAPTDPKATVKDLPNDCSNGRSWCNVNAAWGDKEAHVMRVHGQPRTSLITFPADGRVPFRVERAPRPQPVDPILGPGLGILDNPEDRPLPERCLVSQNFRNGALMTPTLYNNNMQIVQSKDTVAIMVEMSHEARLVRMGGTHRTDGIKPWFGDSIGRYEGPTLVVETTNFHPAQLTRESSKLKITERFTRTAKDKVLYQFTVDDPDTYTQVWGGEYEFSSSPGQIFEYACHEGNRGMEGLLIGARHAEKEAAAATRPQAAR
jgi:hypothetical protein